MKFEMKKLKEFILTVKGFNFTKHLLNKKERNLLHDIEFFKEMIESYEGRIIAADERIIEYKAEIIDSQKTIKQLETDVKKIQKVIKLY